MMGRDLEDARRVEHAKYARAYAHPRYRMKDARRADALSFLAGLPGRSSYLDVSCGHGDMLLETSRLGFQPVQGLRSSSSCSIAIASFMPR